MAAEHITAHYENAIVTFIDILGFRDIVLNSSCTDVESILERIEYFTDAGERDPDYAHFSIDPAVYTFSDSIIRIRPIERYGNRHYPVGLLFHELLDLVHVQGGLSYNGILLRGAVSYGSIRITDTRVFGPALIRAYELEKNCALYPRIIIDPELISEFQRNRLLRNEIHSLEEETRYISNVTSHSDDGFVFVDYLRAMESESDPVSYPSFLSSHRDVIIQRAQGHQLPQNIAQKVMWLARYHNSIITALPDEFYEHHQFDKDRLLITQGDIGNLVQI